MAFGYATKHGPDTSVGTPFRATRATPNENVDDKARASRAEATDLVREHAPAGALIMEVALSVLCVAAVLLLLRAEYRRQRGLKVVSKTIASLAFVAVGLLRRHGTSTALSAEDFLVGGLIFGALGDVLLVFQGTRFFLGGLVAFLIGHVGYVVAFAYVAPPASWLRLPALFVAAFGAIVLSSLWAKLGVMRVPVVVYVVTICVMVVAAIAVHTAGAPNGLSIAVGAVFFAVSDVAVARERFVESTFAHKAWGLPLYYLAQLLIAWSIGV